MNRRYLLITNFYPPHIKGGAELAATQLARWLARHGQTVAVLTLVPPGEAESTVEEEPNLTVYRRSVPNLYHALEHGQAAAWKKPFWHALDHYHPVAAAKLRDVLESFRPDVVNTHNVSGMGYNMWQVLGDAGLPVIVSCHDLTLLCLRQCMFKDGENCETQCGICRVSSAVRGRYVSSIRQLLFMSPTRALLNVLRPAFPPHAQGVHLPYLLDYPTRPQPQPPGSVLQLIYVGQVTPHKGVPFLFEVLDSLPHKERFHIKVVGKGPSLEPLREKYAGCAWAEFVGFVPPEGVDAQMRAADVLVVPSLWFENQPLVVIQGRSLGLPLIVSDRGGLPELVVDSVFGRILKAGDFEEWRAAFEAVLSDPPMIERWKQEAFARRDEFASGPLGARFLEMVDGFLTTTCARS